MSNKDILEKINDMSAQEQCDFLFWMASNKTSQLRIALREYGGDPIIPYSMAGAANTYHFSGGDTHHHGGGGGGGAGSSEEEAYNQNILDTEDGEEIATEQVTDGNSGGHEQLLLR